MKLQHDHTPKATLSLAEQGLVSTIPKYSYHRAIIEVFDGETDSLDWPVYWSTTDDIPELVKDCADLKPHLYIGRLVNNRWLAGQM